MRDPQTAHSNIQVDGKVLEAELLGARSVADHERVTISERVAGLEVGADPATADVRLGEPGFLEPGGGRQHLHPALGVAHVREHDVVASFAVHDEPEVHRVDHVRCVRALLEHVDDSARGTDRVDQVQPLLTGPDQIRLVGKVHVRVDRVVHAEVIRLHHQVPVAPLQLLSHFASPALIFE